MKIFRTGPFDVNTLIVPLVRNLVFIVDPADCEFSADENTVCNFLEKEKLQPVAIILTHGHFDHVSGLKSLRKSFPEIPIAIHKYDSNLIGADSEEMQSYHLMHMGFTAFLPFVSELPDATHFLDNEKNLAEIFYGSFKDDKELYDCLKCWQVIHTPGHTEGSCCLYNEKEKILISGDTLFFQSWGRTDLPGGDEQKIRKSLIHLAEIVDGEALVFPGHETAAFKMRDNL